MPPKRGTKRKKTNAAAADGDAPLAPPDRATWPGWVEMESEPAFFNVMLREMGVRGVKVEEVFSLEDVELAILPRPIHALIFLFRYNETEKEGPLLTSCPDHVWFANQIPDFACATFALLNIVNNITGLNLGKELQTFKDFTGDMDPLSKGDAVDSFDFVKRIHNSFARENDLLQADMHQQAKVDKYKKRLAVAKARETREAKKSAATPAKTPIKEDLTNETTPSRSSTRTKRPTPRKSVKETKIEDDPDGDFDNPTETKAEHTEQPKDIRRSARTPKPRTTKTSTAAVADTDLEAEEGFHFVAYMPIQGHVWKLDGLDRFPQDMGSFSEDEGGDWMRVAQPELVGRMAQYQDSVIQFNLMAIVHDPLESDREALLRNVKELRALDEKLDGVFEGWRDMEGAQTKKDVITGISVELGVTEADVGAVTLEAGTLDVIEKEDDLLKLIERRGGVIEQQAGLRAAVRDAMAETRADDEKARHRRHDYGTFVRSWLGALADQEVLAQVVDG